MGEPLHRAPEDVDRESSALERLFEGEADPVPPSPPTTPDANVPVHPERSDA
jgi:hypothetical protein